MPKQPISLRQLLYGMAALLLLVATARMMAMAVGEGWDVIFLFGAASFALGEGHRS